MGITSSGVKGYEYQYLASVYIALSLGLEKIDSFLIEKEGSEDAFLEILLDSKFINVEIQVKRESSILDIPKLSDWLTHFQEKITDNNLLQRLKTTDELVLFVTRSRCDDDTAQFRNKISSIQPHTEVSINNEWNSTFTKSIANYSDKTIKLQSERKDFCVLQAKELEDKGITISILKKVLIWEELNDDDLQSNIELILNKKYNIAQSQAVPTLNELEKIVRKGRDEKIDVISQLKELILKRRAGAPNVEPHYRKRQEDDIFYQELKETNLLLLTGSTLCGKSELAKQIAFRFFAEGYNYLITTDLQNVNYFFAQNVIEDKIAILEDPWGHLEKNPDSLVEWKKIENFINNSQANHKLIITSRKEIIQDIHSVKDFYKKKLGEKYWHDLTLTDTEFLSEYWNFISLEKSLSNEIIQAINSHLATAQGEEKLQLGQLQFLAGNDKTEIANKTQSELEHIARMNSQEIGDSIRNKDQELADFLSLLSLTSNTTVGVNSKELAYILSEEEVLYSKTDKDFWTSGGGIEPEKYPSYKSDYFLNDRAIQNLEYLERRGFVIENEGYLYFTHPNYFEAGRYLFSDISSIGQHRFLLKLKKALFVIHPDTAYLVANQFSFIAKKISKRYLSYLFEISFEGLNSIYPSVEDRLIVFLIEYMNQLTEKQKECLVLKLESGGAPSSHIFWYEESIPYISTEGGRGLRDYLIRLLDEEISQIIHAFRNREVVKSFIAWNYVLTVQNSGKLYIAEESLTALLQYREVFLRRRAAFLYIVRKKANIVIDALQEIFSDVHPSVVYEGIRGCFMVWDKFTSDIKAYLITTLAELYNQKPIAIRVNNLMTTFANEHSHDSINWEGLSEDEKGELWKLWGKLFPIFIQQLPVGVYLRAEHFDLTITEAVKYLEYTESVKLLETWFERIDYRIKSGGEPDEYEMAVADHLMRLTKQDNVSRSGLFQKLISCYDTSFLLSNLKWIVEYWSYLHEIEKSQILTLAKSDRRDVLWIKAVLLNTYSTPPGEIQLIILGNSCFFELEPKILLSIFPEDILLHCLHVYFGHPQPLWWLAVHHHNRKFWGKIIRLILYKKQDPYYSLCLRGLLTNGVNGFSSEWRDGFKIWKTLCRRPGKMLEQTNRLIYETASSTCSIRTTRNLWKYMIRAYRNRGREKEIISLIVANIEALQQTGNKEDLFDFFGRDFLLKEILPQVQPDYLIISLLEQVINNTMLENTKIKFIEEVINHNNGLRFYYTSLFINYAVGKYSLSEESKGILLSIPNAFEKIGEERLKDLAKEMNEGVRIWNWLNY